MTMVQYWFTERVVLHRDFSGLEGVEKFIDQLRAEHSSYHHHLGRSIESGRFIFLMGTPNMNNIEGEDTAWGPSRILYPAKRDVLQECRNRKALQNEMKYRQIF